MALGSGLAAQFGFVSEVTYGTAVTVTKFCPLIEDSFVEEIPRTESAGIIAGKRVIHSDQWTPGIQRVAGDVGLELYQQGVGTLFRHMLGSVTSSVTNSIGTHTFSPGDLTGQSMTVQIGKPQVGGVVTPFTYSGVKVTSWEMSIVPGEAVGLGLSLVSKSVTTGTALASATYITHGARPHWGHSTGLTAVSISGSNVCVRQLVINGDNMLDVERFCIGQTTIDEPLESGLRTFGGTATIEFSSTAQYQRFNQGGEYPISATVFASSSAFVSMVLNARFDGATPAVAGPGLIVVEYPFKCVATSLTNDATAISAVVINSQTAGQI